MTELTAEQLTGRDESHLEFRDGRGLTPACWEAFDALQADAREAGFDLQVASAFRSFDRQRLIFNGKATGERTVHDDRGAPIDILSLPEVEQLHAILRFSALPGASRHHWGTDLDVFDAAACPPGYQVQLTPEEVVPEGIFGPLHAWLDQRMAAGEAHGFFRPYDADRGGVAVERWHLSFAPQSAGCEQRLSESMLAQTLADCELALADSVQAELPDLYQRYVRTVSPPPDACAGSD